MAEPKQRWMYRVHGFGKHVGMREVEFLDKLRFPNVCHWCGAAPSDIRVLSCGHVMCSTCCYAVHHTTYNGSLYPYESVECMFDELETRIDGYNLRSVVNTLGKKEVRCLNADGGCGFMGSLGDLNEHLRSSCEFYFMPCSKCGNSMVYKDRRSHYTACKGPPGILLRAADSQSLLDGIGDACKMLGEALTVSSIDKRDAVLKTSTLLNEQFAKIQSKLRHRMPRTPERFGVQGRCSF